MKNLRRVWRPAAAVVMGLACGSAAGAAGPELQVSRGAGRTTLAWGSAAFHSTPDRVIGARVVQDPTGDAAYAVWAERNAAGAVTHFYAGVGAPDAAARAVDTTYLIRLNYASFDPLAEQPAVDPLLRAAPASGLHLVQFLGPPTEPMRQAIRAMGGSVDRFLTDHTHLVRMSPAVTAAVAALPFVRWVGPFHTAYKLEQSILVGAGGDQQVPARYSVAMVERGPAAQARVARAVEALGGRVHLSIPQGFRIEATMSLGAVLKVAALDDVLAVEAWSPPGNDMDIARQISNSAYAATAFDFNGEGVRAEVLDSGLLATHLAFLDPNPLINNGNSPDISHGTSTYGIVFGNGAAVPQGLGVLPGREQGIFSTYYNLTNRYTHTQGLVNPSGQFRAVFQSNSWGTNPVTTYTATSAEIDDIVFDLDILLLQSQGNTNSNTSRPQAWAKNNISVGGVVHRNTLTRADDQHKGASYGPAADGRVKPDLTHFFDEVLTTSSLSNTAYTPGFNGTSAATPITAGHAGLVYQMWHEGVFSGFGGGASVFADRPHVATVKALLVNSAFRYPFAAGETNLTRDKQGWGMVDLQPLLDRTARTFVVNETDLVAPLGKRVYRFRVEPSEPDLRVTMVYNDPQGSPTAAQARINDLSLRVTSPGGTVYWGNNGLKEGNWSVAGGVSNKVDTTENVFIQNPPAGLWLIEVLGDQIVQDGHVQTPAIDADFALVAAGGENVPPIKIVLQQPAPTLVAPGAPTVMDLTITPGYENPVPGSGRLFYRFGPGAYLSAPLTALGGENYTATLPGAPCASLPEFYLSVQGDGGSTVTNPPAGSSAPYAATVGTIETIIADDFENDAGWTVENTFLQDGAWERGVPAGNGQWGDPTSDYDGSGKCWVTGLALNSDVDGGPTVLTSSPYDLAAFPQAEVSYARWIYTNELTSSDNLRVQISPNGTNWFTLENVGDDVPGWVVRKFRIADFFPPGAQVRLRLTIKDDPLNSLTEAGLDALKFTTIACSNPCYADCNGDGGLSVADFGCFQSKFVAGDPYADCNGDGTNSVADFGCFQTKFIQGCPP